MDVVGGELRLTRLLPVPDLQVRIHKAEVPPSPPVAAAAADSDAAAEPAEQEELLDSAAVEQSDWL